MNIHMLPMCDKDMALFKALYCDDRTMRFLAGGLRDKKAEELFYMYLKGQSSTPPSCLIYTVFNEMNEKLGLVGGFFDSGKKHTLHLGSMILPAFQKSGVSTWAIRKYRNKVYKTHGIKYIQTKSISDNLGASKLMQKLNFELINTEVSKAGKSYNFWRYKLN